MRNDIVIIGSGMAGYALAREIKKLDQGADITIVTADDGAQYSKPMLSNAFAQNKSADALVQKNAASAAQALGVRIVTHATATYIDRAQKRIGMAREGMADTLRYDRLVLATGARPRPYSVEGSQDAPIATVNSLDDYRRWRNALHKDERVLLIGAGLIGVEFANDLAIAGHAVTVVDPALSPLGRLLPEVLGPVVTDALQAAGIDVIVGRALVRVRRDDCGFVAELDDGRTIAFDRALAAIGLIPNVALAEGAGLAVGQGVKVDRHLRTSDADIFAIGDCAETDAGVLPFVLPLMAEARALAKTLTGEPTALHLPALPVVVKTPALPIVVCPPRPGAEGAWTVEGDGADRRAVFTGADGRPLGFTLTGSMTSQRMDLAKVMPDLLPTAA